MLPFDPEREAVSRSIAAVLMARQIKQAGQIHAATLLTELGALAGFAAQMSIRKSVIEPQKLDPNTVLVEVVTKNGQKFYFSELLNWMLFENMNNPPYCVWAYVVSVVSQDSRLLLPDLSEIVSNAARTVGTRRFGVPRLRAEYAPHKSPRVALDEGWRVVQGEFSVWKRDAAEWPYDLALAAQWQMLTSREQIPLTAAAAVVMEAAIPMSKVDPATVPGALE